MSAQKAQAEAQTAQIKTQPALSLLQGALGAEGAAVCADAVDEGAGADANSADREGWSKAPLWR